MLDEKAHYHIGEARVHGRIDRAAESTVETVVYELRTYGLAQLKKPNSQWRLGELSPEQLREVLARLIRLRPQYPKALAILNEKRAEKTPLGGPPVRQNDRGLFQRGWRAALEREARRRVRLERLLRGAP